MQNSSCHHVQKARNGISLLSLSSASRCQALPTNVTDIDIPYISAKNVCILDRECDPDAWKMTIHWALYGWFLVGIKRGCQQKQLLKYQMRDITKRSLKIGNIFNNFVLLMISHCGVLYVVPKWPHLNWIHEQRQAYCLVFISIFIQSQSSHPLWHEPPGQSP